MTPEQRKAAALDHAWSTGNLAYKCRPYQDSVRDAIWTAITTLTVLKFCLNISRRWGKTWLLCLIATEMAIRKPGSQIRFAAPTGIELRKRTLPLMRQIMQDCPAHLKPRWNGQDKCFTWPNGSQLHVAGVNDGHADDLRGSGCDLAVVDEGGFVDDLDYVVGSVLMPQTLDNRGTLIGSSTPPRTLAHDYYDFAMGCREAGNYVHRDIYSTGRPLSEIELYANDVGGLESTTFKREYKAEFVVDQQLCVVPEWHYQHICPPPTDPLRSYWQNYTAMDIGESKNDFTAVLFGYYDFANARLFIENELIDDQMPRMDTQVLAHAILAKEQGIWGESYRSKRVADNNTTELLVDLARCGMPFHPTSKDELYAMVNKVRIWAKGGRIRVAPHCLNLLDCLSRGIWKDEQFIGRDFSRSKKLGHLDALAALIYMIRNIDETTNPVPKTLSFDPQNQVAPRGGWPQDETTATLRGLFTPKRID